MTLCLESADRFLPQVTWGRGGGVLLLSEDMAVIGRAKLPLNRYVSTALWPLQEVAVNAAC